MAGQKRSAGTPGEPSSSSSQKPTKKTRVLDPSEDPANFAEQVDEALENPAANRRNRVKNEGYDSDSSDDGEGVVYSRKKGTENDEDEDMFNIAEKEDKKDDGAKKEKKFMRLGDIEGQEFGKSGSEDDSSAESDEPEDEDDAERRKKAGMGYELSSFNMREEMEEGKFTEDGNYIRSFDPHVVHDRWMDGLDEKEIRQARKRKKQQERIEMEKAKAEEKEIEESGGKPAMEKQLLAMLKKGETVLEALQRFGAEAKRSKGRSKQYSGDVNMTKETSPIEQITHLASNIMSLGNADIYSTTYEELVRSVRRSGLVDDSWTPPSADKLYEYKWDMPGAGQTGETFGPFGEEEMRSWYKASYFGPIGEKVKVRQLGGEWGDWDDVLS
ncbi:lin1 family protein [Moniliophthora roreri MCA 2997]|uniref:Lin1 family protein n=2 Tax=Moniliophthora roreri TaxID=221103 RepID=V2XNS2_MONRO|nr:lin1 family protein [Moniliophthora roreri MCA 2997]KAI3610510.1 lin1 family protein [Moniliophthora roreri]